MNNERISFSDFIFLAAIILFSIIFANISQAANPTAPTSVNVTSNETKNTTLSGGALINITGGYLATVNISATQQNTHWKGMVGYLSGQMGLDDATGSTLFDWSTIVTTGKVYATRNSSAISWAQIKCANRTILEAENLQLNHSRSSDNLTTTFSDTSHRSFNVGSVPISANTCPTLNTYVNNVTQQGEFEEVALFDGTSDATPGNLVYAGLLNLTKVGFDSKSYDFQMIVPERGLATWSSSTAYFLYVEIN